LLPYRELDIRAAWNKRALASENLMIVTKFAVGAKLSEEGIMSGAPDFRQMMNALDEALTATMKAAFNNLYVGYGGGDDKNALGTFSTCLTLMRRAYTDAASEIEKPGAQITAAAPAETKAAKTIRA
jgi:hypothetical protein